MQARTATVIGATGLIGSHLVQKLQENNHFQTIRLLVRRPVSIMGPKIEVKLVNFQDHESFKIGIDASSDVFCAIGTTMKKVKGDKNAYRSIDFDIPVNAAQYCEETGCNSFLLVSSIGANSKAGNFYLRLKGEVEDAIRGKKINSISIFRPSMLLGKREEIRTGESIGQSVMKVLSPIMGGSLFKYKPIEASVVATAMVQASLQSKPGLAIYDYKGIQDLLQS
ncbi:MAG: NAD(P)H-binding protein [Candidatus Dadabacteria bacterium]